MIDQLFDFLQIGATVGDGPSIHLRGFRHITKKMYATVSLESQFRQNFMAAGLQASKLNKNEKFDAKLRFPSHKKERSAAVEKMAIKDMEDE